MNKRRNVVYILALIFTLTFTGVVVAIFLDPNLGARTMFWTQVTTYTILTIIYIVTILYLLVTLDKLVADKEELQTRSVKR